MLRTIMIHANLINITTSISQYKEYLAIDNTIIIVSTTIIKVKIYVHIDIVNIKYNYKMSNY